MIIRLDVINNCTVAMTRNKMTIWLGNVIGESIPVFCSTQVEKIETYSKSNFTTSLYRSLASKIEATGPWLLSTTVRPQISLGRFVSNTYRYSTEATEPNGNSRISVLLASISFFFLFSNCFRLRLRVWIGCVRRQLATDIRLNFCQIECQRKSTCRDRSS